MKTETQLYIPKAGGGIASMEYETKLMPKVQNRIDKIVEADKAIRSNNIPAMIRLVDECREIGMDYTVLLLREKLHWK